MFVDRGSFGRKLGGYFFQLTVGANQIEVFRATDRSLRISSIPYDGNATDPRRDIARLAAIWLNDNHGPARRAG